MLIRMIVNHDDPMDTFKRLKDEEMSKGWEEEFDTDCNCLADAPEGLTATEYAQRVINFFNDTLKPGEMPRRLIKAEEIA